MFTPEQKAKFSNPNVQVFMTSQEGEALATAGLILADPSQKDPANQNAFLVTLTAAGQAALAAPAQPPAAPATPAVPPTPPAAPAAAVPPVAPAAAPATPATGVGYDASQTDNISPIVMGVGLPAPKKRGGNTGSTRKSQYPYEQLPEPQMKADGSGYDCASFHIIPDEGKTIEDLVKKMSSNTSAANRRFEEPDLDANGQTQLETYDKRTFTRDAEGGYVLDEAGKRTSTVEQKTRTKMKRTRKFVSAEVSTQDPAGPGVRVFRVPLS